VINYVKRKVNVLKHLGSGDNKEEIEILKEQATNWIKQELNRTGLFQDNEDSFFKNYQYEDFTYRFAYEFLEKIYLKFNFNKHLDWQVKDLIISKILEPGSTRHCIDFLEEFLDIKHSQTRIYNWFKIFDEKLKDNLEKEIIEIAKNEFDFDFSFVLYDVTTLYFESFKNDEFKRPGFSKDNKHNQPQIVIGLVVTKEGFPVHYEVFKGNTFEGNTFLPIILDFKNKHDIKSLTVVADSAMLSKQNIELLKLNNLNYIISARLFSLTNVVLENIYKNTPKNDRETIRIDDLILEFSSTRFKKDKREMEKQIEKAKQYENTKTSKISKLKFLKNDKVNYFLNEELIDRNSKLLGIKGYFTNLKNSTNREIVDYYHNLFKIEHAFRIAKSDLEARPIYHHKENSIKNHILLCFVALSISVFLELRTELSIRHIVKVLKTITDAKIQNKITGEILINRKILSKEAEELIKMSY
jgi:transposase